MSGQNPLVAAFANAVGARCASRDPAAVWDCEALFRHLANQQFAETVLNDGLRALVDSPVTPSEWSGGRLTLASGRDDSWRLSLRLIDRPRRYLHGVVRHALLAPVNGRPLAGDRYALPPGFQNAVFDPSQRLIPDGRFRIAAGEVLRIEADRAVFDPQIDSPVLVLMLESAPVSVLEWHFSRDTLHAWACRDGDPVATDLKLAAWLCGRFAHQTSLAPVKALVRHADPGVRWAALQSLGRFSRADAHKLLTAALDDPHPVVRRSAKQLLEQDARLDPRDRRWR